MYDTIHNKDEEVIEFAEFKVCSRSRSLGVVV
jgi:hypothetical protein